jgi:serine/threonine protein kinase
MDAMSLSDVNRSNAATAPLHPAPGQVIGGRYLLEGPIGEGGMGVVCRGRHLGLGTAVAIKLIRSDLKEDAECVQRFLNEARRAAALHSERIARVHDVGQLDTGEPYLVMELLEGSELARHLERHGPLAQAEAVAIVLQICEGLAEAHALGVVHRDVKPANVFLARRPDGQLGVKLLDFGISKQFTDPSPSSLTGHDESLGSPWYMSPEQMMDPSNVDQRSDIWSVGVVLYELLTARRPFEGNTIPEICAKVLTAPAPSVRDQRADVDPELDALVQQCLAKHPDDRFHDVVALGTALQHFAAGFSGVRTRVTPTEFFAAKVEEVEDVGDLGPRPLAQRASTPQFDSKTWFETPPSDSASSRDSDPAWLDEGVDRFDSTAPFAGPTIPATPTLRRRVRRAHVLGVVGVLGVATLLGFAIFRGAEDPSLLAGSRIKTAADRVPTVGARLRNAVPASFSLPPLTPGPEPLPLDRGNEGVPILFARTAPVFDSTPGATVELGDEEEASDASEYADPTGPGAVPMPERALSAAEVRERLARYEAWLREQGLTRLDEVEVKSDAKSDSTSEP